MMKLKIIYLMIACFFFDQVRCQLLNLTINPTVAPVITPSLSPSVQVPMPTSTQKCEPGSFLDDTDCTTCPVGKFSNESQSKTCRVCTAGKYASTTGSTICSICSAGKFSNTERTSCDNCEAGEYSYLNQYCVACEKGKYAPIPLAETCLDCIAGYYVNTVNASGTYYSETGSTSCTTCDIGYDSDEGSSSCDLADTGYYFSPLNPENALLCPKNSECIGRTQAPVPVAGYWVDRRSYDYADGIHKCSRDTCAGGDTANSSYNCWSISSYDSIIESDSECASDKVLCRSGAQGPLCGSCKEGFTYQPAARTCESCANPSLNSGLIIIGVICVIIAIMIGFVISTNKFEKLRYLLSCFDGGSLKVIWVTYQIIISCSWNINVTFPDPFNNMLGFMTIFSFDFLSLECLQQGSSQSRYFQKIYLWCGFPILLTILIVMVGAIRLTRQMSQYEFNHDKKQVVNQHVWMVLLLTYLVLPPVANKQFQALDCITLSKEKIQFLRIDSMIDCDSNEYKEFQSVILLFILLYQSIPMLWMVLLYYNRSSLDRQIQNYDETLELYIRDNEKSLDYIRFLFNDYRVKKWWFEVIEMYRRIVFIGVIPLASTVAATRASFGLALAIASALFFREKEPYRFKFTNFIAYVAQVAILLTFYAAISIETGVMISFGLSGVGLGVFLVVSNLSILLLVMSSGIYRFKKHQNDMVEINDKAESLEWAVSFSAEKFRTTFDAINERSVPASNILLFHYTSFELAKVAMRSGMVASQHFDGIPFTLRHPHQTGSSERVIFSNNKANADATSFDFPNEVLLVVSLPAVLLRPLRGYEKDNFLCCLNVCVLSAMRSMHPSNIVDVKPWIDGLVLLPPTSILREYALVDVPHKNASNSDTSVFRPNRDSTRGLFQHSNSAFDTPLTTIKKTDIIKVHVVDQILDKMKSIRDVAFKEGLVPLYHYTTPAVVPLIMKNGLRMSSQGQGDGGVYFSTRGPLSYDLGTKKYEENIIKDCFGIERLDEYLGKGNLDAVIIYGCEPSLLIQAPGGRDNAKMIPKSTFMDLMLPRMEEGYFLRPDRILGIFIMEKNIRFKKFNSRKFECDSEILNDENASIKLKANYIEAETNAEALLDMVVMQYNDDDEVEHFGNNNNSPKKSKNSMFASHFFAPTTTVNNTNKEIEMNSLSSSSPHASSESKPTSPNVPSTTSSSSNNRSRSSLDFSPMTRKTFSSFSSSSNMKNPKRISVDKMEITSTATCL